MRLYIFIACSACVLLATSCKKKTTEPASAADVQINITSPAEGAVYHAGDSVHVTAAISFNGVLHGYEVNVMDTATGNVVFDVDEHVHKDTFVVNQAFLVTGSEPITMKLRLVTEVDHNGTVAEKQVFFRYQP
jgi:hypothetical protein